jgi:ABC-type Fe3+-hydroxamate transport system substrate-binding protein
MEARDPGQDLRSLAVFGILLDKSSNVEAYQKYIKGVYDDIEKKIGSKFGSTGVLITSLTSNMSGQGSGYTTMIEMAGGYNALDMEESSIKINSGDTWFLDPKYAVDIMFVGASCGYSDSGFKEANITSYKNLYKDHNAWTNGDVNIYSTSIPVVVRVAYYAEAMYPDCFEEGFGHNLHQEYVNKFFKTTYEVNDDLCMKKINVD